MKLCNVDSLTGKEILARPIMTGSYQILLAEGTELRQEYIEKIKELGIQEVYINDVCEEGTVAKEILKAETENSLKEKVQSILEKHTYNHNEDLAELSNTADVIITSIVSDDNIMNQVYDIKERSSDLYEHSLTVCALSTVTALKLGMNQEIVHDISVGCLLHDIGLRYITIPYENVDMNTASNIEAAEYKKHPVYGYSALLKENWISDISKKIILYHHERTDGSGYPLHATDIPRECQVVNICNQFDEMICGIGTIKVKVYEAIEYLKTFKKTKFDDTIVDAFLAFTAVYPVGTVVQLSNGEKGLVIRQNNQFSDRPVIRIVQDAIGKKVTKEIIRDLTRENSICIEKAVQS
ncbi:MAG: HD domain-containing protein [Lachnospiraceae bacterium]|nr:HD domain-containing protein [Lachnospiraceae bacterium]